MIERDVVEKNPEERRCTSVCIPCVRLCDGSAPAERRALRHLQPLPTAAARRSQQHGESLVR
jgi:hypothetical protein